MRRYKRFLADIRVGNGRVVTAHCANPGSMLGCMEPGSRVYLSRRHNQRRRLPYTWEMIRVGRTWIGVNPLLANRLVVEGIESGLIAELQGYARLRREVSTHRRSRLDLYLESPGERCYAEVKSVTLAWDGVAAFPDAITLRGVKHLKELLRLRSRGHRAVLVFVIQRDDCTAVRAADEIDAEYGVWLRRAIKGGVEVLPYGARVTPQGITLTGRIPLRF